MVVYYFSQEYWMGTANDSPKSNLVANMKYMGFGKTVCCVIPLQFVVPLPKLLE